MYVCLYVCGMAEEVLVTTHITVRHRGRNGKTVSVWGFMCRDL